jgi:hypothetical protein
MNPFCAELFQEVTYFYYTARLSEMLDMPAEAYHGFLLSLQENTKIEPPKATTAFLQMLSNSSFSRHSTI